MSNVERARRAATGPWAADPDDLLAILWSIAAIPTNVTTVCLACGCLCTLDEHCPGCRARRANQRSH